MVSQTPATPPKLSNFLLAAQEWMQENYASAVVRHALDAREQVSADAKRALDDAIKNSGVRVPGGGFRPQAAHRAPSHHLQMPIFRKLHESDELVGAILRVWMGSKTELYEAVVQHLQGNDEPTYGPDRRKGCFRDVWDTRDWEANRDQFLVEHDEFDRDDVGLMLWCVSGKIPLPPALAARTADSVDFTRWHELLQALPPDAPQWGQAREFALALSELADSKEKQRAHVTVNILKAKVVSIRQQFSEELTYLERDVGLWAAPVAIQPSVAAQALEHAARLESLLGQYRPIRDQAQVRSEEYMRANRRAGLEAEIITALGEMERFLFGSPAPEDEEPPPRPDSNEAPAARADAAAGPVVKAVSETLPPPEPPPLPAPEQRASVPVPAPAPIPDSEAKPDYVNREAAVASLERDALLQLDLQAFRDEIESLKAELHFCKDNVEYWRSAYVAAAKGPKAVYATARPRDVNAAVAQAKGQFPDELLFQLNSKSWTKNNPYEDPQAVLDALEWLATTYHRSRIGEISVPKLDDSIYEVCRWRYVSNQSDVTMGQYGSFYRTVVDGKTYWLEEHIGRGSSKDPVNTIRIAFHWDRERRRIIIGYIGQHQQTDAT